MQTMTQDTGLPIFAKSPFKDYFDADRVGFLDLETTGLSPKHHQVILAGIVVPGKDTYLAKQYFAETPEEEIKVLRAVFEEFRDLDAVVTFNGKQFDVPFMEKRLAEMGVEEERLQGFIPYNLDLYVLAKKYSELRKFMPNMKQKSLEAFLGLWQYRSDEISGGDSVHLYKEWVASGNLEAREKVLLHNFDDIVQLTRLMKVISRSSFHEAMGDLGFPKKEYTIDCVEEKRGSLHVLGRQDENAFSYESFDRPGEHVIFHAKDRTFEIQEPIVKRGGISFLVMPSENAQDRAIIDEIFSGDPAYVKGCVVIETEGRIDYRARNKAAVALVERVRHDGL